MVLVHFMGITFPDSNLKFGNSSNKPAKNERLLFSRKTGSMQDAFPFNKCGLWPLRPAMGPPPSPQSLSCRLQSQRLLPFDGHLFSLHYSLARCPAPLTPLCRVSDLPLCLTGMPVTWETHATCILLPDVSH